MSDHEVMNHWGILGFNEVIFLEFAELIQMVEHKARVSWVSEITKVPDGAILIDSRVSGERESRFIQDRAEGDCF